MFQTLPTTKQEVQSNTMLLLAYDLNLSFAKPSTNTLHCIAYLFRAMYLSSKPPINFNDRSFYFNGWCYFGNHGFNSFNPINVPRGIAPC